LLGAIATGQGVVLVPGGPVLGLAELSNGIEIAVGR
jgi:hypothetical protein